MSNDLISRQAAIDALWKALHAYEDKTERQFIETDELNVGDWMEHRIFVQNMNDIDRQTILELPSAERHGKWVYGEDEDGVDGYRCNKCGFFVTWDYKHTHIHFIDDYLFCPHCNARMDEVE